MTKKKTEIDLRYDATTPKNFSFPIPFGQGQARVTHCLKPLSDERYLKWEIDSAEVLRKTISQGEWKTEQYEPKVDLWGELATNVPQFGENWKKRTKWEDKVNAINLLLHAVVEERAETDEESNLLLSAEEILPEDQMFEIKLWVLHGGITLEEWKKMINENNLPDWVLPGEASDIFTLVERGFVPNMLVPTVHRFREESKDEVDEFLAITTGKNKRGKLASRAKSKKIEDSDWFRKIELYDAVCKEQEGYKTAPPAYHKIPVIESFFAQQIARMGKLQLS